MTKVTIHSHNRKFEGAELVGSGDDTLEGSHKVLIIRHPDFEQDLDFYAEADDGGRHFNVGNRAFWITKEELS